MTISVLAICALAALLGVAAAVVVSLIPGLHIYNVIAFTMLLVLGVESLFSDLDPMIVTCFMLGNVVGFSVLFTVSGQYFQPCDERFRSLMMPHERYLFEGRAHEATMVAGIGSLVALFVCAIGLPALAEPIRALRQLCSPHFHWILGTVIAFIVMSEWPKDQGMAPGPWQRFFDGWGQLLMGYLTFILAGLFGLFLFSRTLVPLESSFQSLMPVFVGMFAVASQIMSLLTKVRVPPQHIMSTLEVAPHDIFRGSASGLVAGAFAGLTPGMTPGPALLMAGHMTASSGDRQFLIGGGMGRVLYYVGGLFMFFLPGLYLRRGGAAINVSLIFAPETDQQFYVVGAVIALAGGVSILILPLFSRFCAWASQRFDYRWASGFGLALLIGIVAWMTGWVGMALMAFSTLLGLLPVFWHTRRINLLAVLLVPICLNMAGVGPLVVRWMGLD